MICALCLQTLPEKRTRLQSLETFRYRGCNHEFHFQCIHAFHMAACDSCCTCPMCRHVDRTLPLRLCLSYYVQAYCLSSNYLRQMRAPQIQCLLDVSSEDDCLEACAKKIIIDVATCNVCENESNLFESVRNRFINVFSKCETATLNEILQSILQFRTSILRDGVPPSTDFLLHPMCNMVAFIRDHAHGFDPYS